MRQIEGVSFEVDSLGLIHHAVAHGDQNARAGLQRYLSEIVLGWLHEHPSREVACSSEGEEHYVALAFEQFWQIVVQRQATCETLSEVLVYLRASLNGAILETLRVSSRPGAVSSPWPDVEDRPDSSELWDRLQARLSNQQERRLTSLLYHCGLEPAEIVRCYPQEWSDVHEVARLRRSILKRLMKGLT